MIVVTLTPHRGPLQLLVFLRKGLQGLLHLPHPLLLRLKSLTEAAVQFSQRVLGVDHILHNDLIQVQEMNDVVRTKHGGLLAVDLREGEVPHNSLQCLYIWILQEALHINGDENSPVQTLIPLYKLKSGQ